MSIVLWMFVSFVMYIGVGSILAIYSKMIGIISDVKNDKLSTKMMVSFMFLTFLMFFCLLSENEIKENMFCLLVGLVICYILNIQILLKIIKNPFCILEDRKQYSSEKRVLIIFCSALILFMLILNMYLLVLWAYYSFENAYVCTIGDKVITKWTLLYYTIISFTTIGYGDISPAIFESQVVAILIASTSVIYLIVFVSSILSEKNKIFSLKETERNDFLD